MKIVTAAIVLLLATGGARAQECAAEEAVYEMPSGGEARLALEQRAEPAGYSDLGIVVRTGDRTQGFSFWLTASNGYGHSYAIPDDEAVSEEGLKVFFFRRSGDRLIADEALPSSGAPAPDAIFLPDLGSALWYATNGTGHPVSIATQIWYLADCG